MAPHDEGGIAKYKGVKMLGEGSFGKVWLVTSDEKPGKTFALKEVAWDELSDMGEAQATKLRDQLTAEVEFLTNCKHEHIIAFEESFGARAVRARLFPNEVVQSSMFDTLELEEDDDEIEPREDPTISGPICLCIVMEHAAGGDLESVIVNAKNKKTKIAEERTWKWTAQLLCALGYLHNMGICHRDIKPANIFLDAEDNVRVGDLGIAKQLTDDASMAQTQIGTYYYMCPEVARNIKYDSKCDIWALGAVMHELMTLKRAFLGTNAVDVLDTIKYVSPAAIPREAYNWHLTELSRWMLQKDPAHRPTALDVYSHLAREWKGVAKEGISLIKLESVPWASDVVMADEGKMAFATGNCIGMTHEERAAMKDKEKEVEFVHPFKAYVGQMQNEGKPKVSLFAKLGQRRVPARQHGVKPAPAAALATNVVNFTEDVGLAGLAKKLEELMSADKTGLTPYQAEVQEASEIALMDVLSKLQGKPPEGNKMTPETRFRDITAHADGAVDCPPVDDAEEAALLFFLKKEETNIKWGALRLRRDIYLQCVAVAGNVSMAVSGSVAA